MYLSLCYHCTMMNKIVYIKISAVYSFVSSESTRMADGRTDRQTDGQNYNDDIHMELSPSRCTIIPHFIDLPSAFKDISFPQILIYYYVLFFSSFIRYVFVDSEIAIAFTSHVKK